MRYGGSRIADTELLAASWDPMPEPVSRDGDSGRLARAVSTYGWRVYALPVLVVLTVLVVLDAAGSSALLPSNRVSASGPAQTR
jgi:hypothetical protein